MADQTSDQPDIVYHYTSTEAMMNIVKTEAVWCTAISYLNDATEREYVLRAVRRRLPILQSQDNSIPAALSVDQIPFEDINDLTPLASEQFVTSFSENRDSLMHWRSYCPQQSGVALGFRTVCLAGARLDEKPEPGMVVPASGFGQVGYLNASDDGQVDKLIRRALLSARFQLSNLSPPRNSEDRLPEFFRWAVEAIACSSKHSSFQSEGEYRLLLGNIRYRENNLRFRAVRSTLVPYVAMRIPSRSQITGIQELKGNAWDGIASVVIGPTANMDLTERSISSFFRMRGIKVEILRSQIPYRDW